MAALVRCAIFVLGACLCASAHAADPSCYDSPDSKFDRSYQRAQIHIRSTADVQRLRKKLITEIWPVGFPRDAMPSSVVETNLDNLSGKSSGITRYLIEPGSSELSAEVRLVVDLGFGIRSVVYMWIPKAPAGKLFLVHDGHADDTFGPTGVVSIRAMENATNVVSVKTLLQHGYSVMWLQLPLYGDNLSESSPTAPFKAGCAEQCNRHAEIFRAFGGSKVNPLRFFLEPVVVAINYATRTGEYSEISMMGSSGGGWATLLAAAVDPRIDRSASVAGSLPIPLRSGVCGTSSVGDAEQMNHSGSLYRRITYLDLYILAGSGADRRTHLQINNQFDSCCFYGLGLLTYAAFLSDYMNTKHLGTYGYYLDTGFHGHGYDVSLGTRPRNNSLVDVILPVFTPEN